MGVRAPAITACRETLPFSDVNDQMRWSDCKQKIAIALETEMQTPKKQGIVRDDRGQTRPTDKQRAQQSQMEGPAAYAPHEDEKKANPKRDAKKKTGHESA